MAGEWVQRLLGELTENFDGVRVPVKESDRRPGPYPYYGASGVVDYVDDFLFDGEYLLIAEDGENLRTRTTPIAFLARGKFWVNNHAHIVRGNREADTRFLMYALSTTDISGYLTGSTMPKLTQGNMNRIPVRTPPLTEQRAIANILGTLDGQIELHHKQNETLESMASALFKAWFVDFEPVRAKIEGRWQRGHSLPGLPEQLYDIFPNRFVASEVGEIPEGWEVGRFSDVVEIIGGGTPKTSISEYWNGDIPWFSVVDTPISSDVFVVQTEKSITQAGLAGSSVRLITKGTTIISARGTVGNLAIAGRDMTFNQSCYGLRGKNGSGSYFVFLSAQHMVEQLKAMAHGSVFSTITRQTFEAVQAVLPTEMVLQQFELYAARFFDPILSNVNGSRALAQLRDNLLPKLISGELRVPDVERIVGAAK